MVLLNHLWITSFELIKYELEEAFTSINQKPRESDLELVWSRIVTSIADITCYDL